ncbi:hypothetical protein CE11_00358 [Megavirus courdo11]|uniref:Chromosomal protein MC1 domain-containing protein n=6 Tax=Megamimivirinae TaxID=3044648 RepID=A0A2L2DLZ9_MIMIV|nr:hypothetical protein MegaChil _gp0347 [Megavirus chiliensis]AEX61459.1 hypothetical protein c7_R395 [Megavirus courdo7]AFX92386.1 hypothetical protein CE11_00358 [Megavirus courdo11]AGD92252.1 hypothetical protein LBA_00333 [Megavirus lba]AUV58290.1 hypothetical protein [Bandra megavirus]AVG47184.1 hypothetical protein [Acanthamoeba polyphaga mimivirus]AVL93680.1 hypothetical protein mvi_320 [Megavirus vitis]
MSTKNKKTVETQDHSENSSENTKKTNKKPQANQKDNKSTKNKTETKSTKTSKQSNKKSSQTGGKKTPVKTKEATKDRYFKLIDPKTNESYGRYTGGTPKQAASKAYTKTVQGLKGGGKPIPKKSTIILRESTRGSPRKYYGYEASRLQLAEPQILEINTDGETKTITYNFRNKIKKIPVPEQLGGVKTSRSAKKSQSGSKKATGSKSSGTKSSGSKRSGNKASAKSTGTKKSSTKASNKNTNKKATSSKASR